MFVVDTNVLIYAANADAPEHERCRALLEGWRAGRAPWYTTWAIAYEFLRVITHPRVLPQPWTMTEAIQFIAALEGTASHSFLVESDRHTAMAAVVVGEVAELRGNLVHDFHTAVLMREHGIARIYTRDADFRRFPFLDVIDPLATAADETQRPGKP